METFTYRVLVEFVRFFETPVFIRVLGKEYKVKVYLKKGMPCFVHTDGTELLITQGHWDGVMRRIESLPVEEQELASSYDVSVWKDCPDPVFSLYLVGMVWSMNQVKGVL